MNDQPTQSRATLLANLVNAVDDYNPTEVKQTFQVFKKRNLHNRYALLDLAIRASLQNSKGEYDVDVIEFFLKEGCDPNLKDWEGIAPLQRIPSSAEPLYQLLIRAGAKRIEAISTQTDTIQNEARLVSQIVNAVHAIDREDTQNALKVLKEQGVHNDHDLLEIAMHSEEPLIVEYFLEMGCDPNREDWNGVLPLQSASNVSLRLCQVLIKHGANPALRSTKDQRTPLHAAVLSKADSVVDIIEYFLQKGALTNVRDVSGNTALMLFRKNREKSAPPKVFETIVMLLSKHESNLGSVNHQGASLKSYF